MRNPESGAASGPPAGSAADGASAVTVRFATAADVAAICALANWAAAETTANFATEPEPLSWWEAEFTAATDRYPWLVADASDVRPGTVTAGLAGFAKAGPFGRRAAWRWTTETTVYVDPAWHGSGIGTALYGRLLALLTAQGFHSALASITSPNPASEALHAACGFTPVGLLPEAGWKWGAWLDVAYWHRPLATSVGPPAPPGPVPR